MVRKDLFAAALVAACIVTPASAEVIFDNTVNASGSSVILTLPQLGSQVTAAGTARLVTELDIGFLSATGTSTADLQAFIYANDGTGGAPGTLLWSSAVKTGVGLTTTPSLIAFTVPGILVPGTFTWVAAITNQTNPNTAYATAAPPTTGTWLRAWAGSPGSWRNFPFDDLEMEGRVVATAAPAVPEPSTLALAGLGLAAVVAAKRKRAAA